MPQTVIPYGSPLANKVQSAGLFAATVQRATNLNRLAGRMPQQSKAESRLRNQTSTDYPIVRAMDLQRTAGDEITFDLVNHISGKPIMGERMAEGRGTKLSFSQDKVRINQTRKPISAGGQMTQQRTPHELRPLARAAAQGYMERLHDQQTLVHLAGARGYHNNIEWAVPVAADPDFAEIMINPVKAPSKNRHFIATTTGIEPMGVTAGETNLITTEVMNMAVVDDIRTVIESIPLPPPPVKFDGDEMAGDSPLRVLMVSSEQYTSFIQSTNFRTLQSQAMARGKGNPIFSGEAGLWNGILIIRMPKPIRFYAGSTIMYCADPATEAETACVVPASFGTGFAVDRALLLGAQAVAEAYGKNSKTGNPYFWSEKELDHGDKLEVLIGAVMGMSKIRFSVDYGATAQFTDQGVIAIDTAVKIAAGQ